MREVTETTPPDLQSFSTGRILKESWEISTKYFGALVMPVVIAVIPAAMADVIFTGLTGLNPYGLFIYAAVLLVALGIHGAIISLKKNGETPTFSKVFALGSRLWPKGTLAALIMAACVAISYFLFVLLVLPGILLWVNTKQAYAGMLIWAGFLAGITQMSWCLIRVGLTLAAVADDKTSPVQAIARAWKITRGKVRTVLPLFSIIAGILLLFFIILIIAANMSSGWQNDEFLTGVFVLFIGLPFFAFVTVAVNLTYLALKPAPEEA
jgi:hypothetical protein